MWLVAPLALLVVGGLSIGIYHLAYELFADAANSKKPRKSVNVNDVIKTTATVLTLIGAVLAGVYAYRKQLLSEGDAHRADASQLADRYTTSAEQLGHERAAVRLAGVYALARLADDWTEQRQVCIDVLCAYLRMPYEPDPVEPGHKEGEREVRHTIVRVIRDHLRHTDARTSWCTYDLDFTGALFDGGDFSYGHFRGTVVFDRARFYSGTVEFRGAKFEGGTVEFRGATFEGGTVIFSWATFSGGTIHFDKANFSGGEVRFISAQFIAGNTVYFDEATFSAGTVLFNWAKFEGGRVDFSKAKFEGGTVIFGLTNFSGGRVGFAKATFSSGTVSFGAASFSGGTVHFSEARFSGGTVHFARARFSGGEVDFSSAVFAGGAVDFSRASGTAPSGLPPSGSRLPTGLILCPTW